MVHCALTTDPGTLGNWSAPITVGEGISAVQTIVSTGRHVYLSTGVGVYDMDDLGQTVNISPYHNATGADDSLHSGIASYYWDGNILYGEANGVDAIDITQPGIAQGQAFGGPQQQQAPQ